MLCPYCNKEAVLKDSAEVYHGHSYGMIYDCRDCDAYVGVRKDGKNTPLGRMANKELRIWKLKAHGAFDPLWQKKLARRRKERGDDYPVYQARASGYKWLREQIGMTAKECSISEMDVEQCKQVIEICSKYHKKIIQP